MTAQRLRWWMLVDLVRVGFESGQKETPGLPSQGQSSPRRPPGVRKPNSMNAPQSSLNASVGALRLMRWYHPAPRLKFEMTCEWPATTTLRPGRRVHSVEFVSIQTFHRRDRHWPCCIFNRPRQNSLARDHDLQQFLCLDSHGFYF